MTHRADVQCPACGSLDREVLPRRFTSDGAGDMRGNSYDDYVYYVYDETCNNVTWSRCNVDCVWLCFDCGETFRVVNQK